ncbi:hypothetical protein MMC11_000677 [Xylographa trunciseda]|nr:hypothetical protein [Xylographa trunciseda]
MKVDDNDDDDENMEHTPSENSMTMTEGSFVIIKPATIEGDALTNIRNGDPDVYDVNVLAWDSPVSPLHLAILEGHISVIELLISKFGADVLLPPVKILYRYMKQPNAAILTLVLVAH